MNPPYYHQHYRDTHADTLLLNMYCFELFELYVPHTRTTKQTDPHCAVGGSGYENPTENDLRSLKVTKMTHTHKKVNAI